MLAAYYDSIITFYCLVTVSGCCNYDRSKGGRYVGKSVIRIGSDGFPQKGLSFVFPFVTTLQVYYYDHDDRHPICLAS